jgi:hypothetical protein
MSRRCVLANDNSGIVGGLTSSSDCEGRCNLMPSVPLDIALGNFAYHWQHRRWDPQELPAEPTEGAAAVSKELLHKYAPP